MKRILLILSTLLGILFVSVSVANTITSSSDATTKTPVDKLGWVSVPLSVNKCCGYYEDPLAIFAATPLPPLNTTAVSIDAKQTIFHQSGRSLLIGQISVAQPGRLVNADRAYLNRDATTGKITSADFYGNVILREPGKYVTGDSGHVELESKIAHLKHAIYRYFLGDPQTITPANAKELTSNAWGKAEVVKQKASGLIQLFHATYSTCAPTENSWKLSVGTLDLDRDAGRGYAHNAWVDVDGVPVFYTPYFDFPIDKKRESGFLFPYFGSSTTSGISLAFPYYWNIAPNYDATITPQIYSRRGLLTNAEFRYLTENSSGSFQGGILPDDGVFKQFQDTAAGKYPVGFPGLDRLLDSGLTRYSYSAQDQTTFDPRWNGSFEYTKLSDDYYQQDFTNNTGFVNNTGLVPNVLPRDAKLNYLGDVWTMNGIVQSYQTLHPINTQAVSNPYEMLPQLNVNANYPDENTGIDYLLNSQFTYFRTSQNPGQTTIPPSAGREHVEPGISYPMTDESGYLTPTLQFDTTHYNVGSQVPGFSNAIQRNLPIFNIDSGLYFDRDFVFQKTDYQQTLEPRMFFLYVPYRNQNQIPLFDTGGIPFNYDALFLTNRFSGIDRIGDADQVTFALTSRFLNADTNAEKFSASIGEIYYFRNRRVQACLEGATPSSCVDTLTLLNIIPPTEKTSPIAGVVNYNINPVWSTSANGTWDPHSHQTIYGGANLQYYPKQNKVINFGYNFIRLGDQINYTPPISPSSHTNDLNQGSVSFVWPIKERWSAVGQYGYNFSHKYPQTYFYGVQYDTCCWALRVVTGRTFSGLNQNNNPTFNSNVYLQFMFKGLATVGTADPTSSLASIPGYTDTFQPFYGLKT